MSQPKWLSPPAFRMDSVSNATVTGNFVLQDEAGGWKESILWQSNGQQVREEGNRSTATPGPPAETLLRQLTEKHDRSALEIIRRGKAGLEGH